MALTPGTVVGGDFHIDAFHAEGGMGVVYRATQISTKLTRALKVMQPALGSGEELARRFEQEVRIGARVESDHVVQFVTSGYDPVLRVPYAVMEWVNGRELESIVESLGYLTVFQFTEVFQQLAHAVAAAHRSSIVHRDLKPGNVMLGPSRSSSSPLLVKVLDFGIAKLLDTDRTSTRGMGTPLWMAPEQSGPNTRVTPATDVWALGLIAFYCLSGKSYWLAAHDAQASNMSLMREILIDPIEAPARRAHALGASFPPWLEAWFVRCIDRAPTQRYANAELAWQAYIELVNANVHSQAVRAAELARLVSAAGGAASDGGVVPVQAQVAPIVHSHTPAPLPQASGVAPFAQPAHQRTGHTQFADASVASAPGPQTQYAPPQQTQYAPPHQAQYAPPHQAQYTAQHQTQVAEVPPHPIALPGQDDDVVLPTNRVPRYAAVAGGVAVALLAIGIASSQASSDDTSPVPALRKVPTMAVEYCVRTVEVYGVPRCMLPLEKPPVGAQQYFKLSKRAGLTVSSEVFDADQRAGDTFMADASNYLFQYVDGVLAQVIASTLLNEVVWRKSITRVRSQSFVEKFSDSAGRHREVFLGFANEIEGKWDARGYRIEERYFGVGHTVVDNGEGRIGLAMQRGPAGELVEMRDLRDDGPQKLAEDHYAATQYLYDGQRSGVPSSEHYLDEKGRPLGDYHSCQARLFDLDAFGNQLKGTCFNSNGEPSANGTGVGYWLRTFDASGRTIRLTERAPDFGKEPEYAVDFENRYSADSVKIGGVKTKHSDCVLSYDQLGRMIATRCRSLEPLSAGPVKNECNGSSFEVSYDASSVWRNNTSPSGLPCVNPDGLARTRREYDAGLLALESYWTLDGQTHSTLNAHSDISQQLFGFDPFGRRIGWSALGVHEEILWVVTTVYDDAKRVRMSEYKLRGNLTNYENGCASEMLRISGAGRVEEFRCLNTAGVLVQRKNKRSMFDGSMHDYQVGMRETSATARR
jgi:hypothetical protein